MIKPKARRQCVRIVEMLADGPMSAKEIGSALNEDSRSATWYCRLLVSEGEVERVPTYVAPSGIGYDYVYRLTGGGA